MGLYGSAPKAPDPKETAAAQFNYDMGTAQVSGIVNNPNTSDPYGQTNYSLSGYETVYLPDGKAIKVPRYSQNTTLTSDGQRLLDQKNALGNQAFEQASRSMGISSDGDLAPYKMGYDTGPQLRNNFSGNTNSIGFINNDVLATLPQADRGNFNEAEFAADRARVENAVYGRGSGLLQENRDAQNAALAAQGIAPGTERAARANESVDRAMNDLAMQAVLAGGQEQSRILGEQRSDINLMNQANQSEFAMRTALNEMENARRMGDMTAYNAALQSYNNASLAQTQINRDQTSFFNQARGATVAEREAIKNADANRLQAIISGTQVQNPNIPGYFTQGIQAPDYAGYVQDNYAQQVAAYNARLGGISGLISGVAGGLGTAYASERAVKHSLKTTGRFAQDTEGNRVPIVKFKYLESLDPEQEEFEGVIAEDLAIYNSPAVVYNDSKPIGVDYAQLQEI